MTRSPRSRAASTPSPRRARSTSLRAATSRTSSSARSSRSSAPGATSVVTGPIGGGGATFQFTSDGVVLDGFTITRQGNNATDWNNPALNSAGVAIQGRTSGTVRNCIITGNRTGIDINNSTGISVHNNVIDDNRTGLIFRNVTDNCAVFENSISNNWTVGVLFLDAQRRHERLRRRRRTEPSFSGNAIAGNWYGQIVDRQSGGALPLPGREPEELQRQLARNGDARHHDGEQRRAGLCGADPRSRSAAARCLRAASPTSAAPRRRTSTSRRCSRAASTRTSTSATASSGSRATIRRSR